MNNNDFMNSNSPDTKYRATRNLNTEIENPEININSAVGVNIKDISPNNSPNSNTINNYFNENLNPQEVVSQPTNFQVQNNYNNISTPNQNTFSYDNTNNFNTSNNYNPESAQTFINNNTTNQVDNNINNQYNVNNQNLTNSNNYIPTGDSNSYQPTLEEKKKPKSFQVPTELKVMIFIVFLLLLFILVIPYIFDFVKGIELTLTG